MSGATGESSNHPHHDEPVESAATTKDDEEVLAALADDFGARIRLGEHPKIDEYVARNPALEQRIRKVLSAVAVIEQTRSSELVPPGESLGATVGRYKLLERIGEGG